METNDRIALIVDPDFGSRIWDVAATSRHTWIVATSANVAIAKQIWASTPEAPALNAQGGVTTFFQFGAEPESWCNTILDTVDVHHNEYSHKTGYSVMVVYGVQLTERLRLTLVELGFSRFVSTEDGFSAHKSEAVARA